jgi:hypothetical protein
VFGHGSEYVFAKLTISHEPRRVALEVSLEYLENPLIDSVDQAREALSSHILIESGSEKFSLGEWPGEVTWSERDRFDESAPAPVPESDEGEEHKLLVARVDLSRLEANSLNLRIAGEGEQAVIFWVDEQAPENEPDSESKPLRWVILIAGDRSMAVTLPPTPERKSVVWISGLIGVGVFLLLIAKRRT